MECLLFADLSDFFFYNNCHHYLQLIQIKLQQPHLTSLTFMQLIFEFDFYRDFQLKLNVVFAKKNSFGKIGGPIFFLFGWK